MHYDQNVMNMKALKALIFYRKKINYIVNFGYLSN